MMPESDTSLTAFQIAVAKLFFSQPESKGFLLAGGSGLAAQHLISRPTQDLDLFTHAGGSGVQVARQAFEAAAADRGWRVREIQDTDTFCRLVVSDREDLLVDLALDSPPNLPLAESLAGPTFALEELAGRKMVALFDRAEARDFADVFSLAQRYSLEVLLRRAADVDLGFDTTVLAQMLGSLSRFRDDELPIDPASTDDLRRFFRQWRTELDPDSRG